MQSRERVLELSDLEAISLECGRGECRTRITLPLNSWKGKLHGADASRAQCPGCGEFFFPDQRRGESNSRLDALTGLLQALDTLRHLMPHRVLVHVQESEKAKDT